MKCVPSSNSVIIGTIDGKVMLVDIREADKPRLVFEKILHKGPLTALRYVVFISSIAFSSHAFFEKKLLITKSTLRSSKQVLQDQENISKKLFILIKEILDIFLCYFHVSCVISPGGY